MTLTTSDIFIAIVLFSCVPLQYFIVQNWGTSESGRSYTLNRIITHLTYFYERYLSLDAWLQWLLQLLNIPHVIYGPEYDDGESPAVEVLKHKQNQGFFAMAPEPRTFRSSEIEFRIGQVIIHKFFKYRGVIVGWDETAKAPAEWLKEMDEKNVMIKNMANYAVLVDTRDRLIPQLTYVPQENMEVVKDIQIFHPLVEHYFEHHDGVQYIPRPWLRTLYPQD